MKFTKMVPCYKNENGEILLGEPIDISLTLPDDFEDKININDCFVNGAGLKLIKEGKEIKE